MTASCDEQERNMTAHTDLAELGNLADGATTVAERALILERVRTHIRTLRDIETRLTDELAADLKDLPGRRAVIDGIGTIEARWNTGHRRWDSQSLMTAILTYAHEHRGDHTETETVLAHLQDVFRFDSPRLTPLRDWGIDPDEYSERVSAGSWRIAIQTATNERTE